MSVHQPACIFMCEGGLKRAVYSTADYLHFNMKEKPHTEVKVEEGLILFFKFLKGKVNVKATTEKKILVQPTKWQRHMVCAHTMVCVCLVREFVLGSSWSPYESLGLYKHFLASNRICISICVSKCMCVYCFVQMPLCTCVLRVGGCRFIGWAHLWSQAVVDSKVISLSSDSLPVSGFHLWSPSIVPSCRPKHSTGVHPLSLSKSLCLCLSENVLSWPPLK